MPTVTHGGTAQPRFPATLENDRFEIVRGARQAPPLQRQSAARAAFGAERVSGSVEGKSGLSCGGRVALGADEVHRAKTSRWGRGIPRSARNDGFGVMRGADGGVGVLDGRGEFAGGEGVEAAETGVEFGGGQAAVAEEPAEKIGGGTVAFERIAFEAAGNQVAVGVEARLDARQDVIEALAARVGSPQTIETVAALAEVDGLAQGAGLEEVELFEVDRLVDGAGGGREAVHGDCAGTSGTDFVGEAHFEDVAGLAAMNEAERAQGDEAADGFADGASAQADSASEPGHGEVELELAFEAAVAEEMRIDGAVGDGEAELRVENVLELFPEKRGI